MALQREMKKRLDRQQVIVLVIAALGTVAVVVIYFAAPGFQPIDLIMLLVVVACASFGFTRRIIRGIMALVMIYFGTGIAASAYRSLAPYVSAAGEIITFQMGAESGKTVSRGVLAFTFCAATALIWIALEAIGRNLFEDTSLPRLGILDNLGGVLVHLIVGVLVATLLFNAMGYGNQRAAHNKALLRPAFTQVLRLYYLSQSFWFPRYPPPILVYDLELTQAD